VISLRTKFFFYPAALLTMMLIVLIGQEVEMCQRPRVWPWGFLAQYAPDNLRSESSLACPFDDPGNLASTVVVLSWMCISGAMFLSVYLDFSRRAVVQDADAAEEVKVEEPRVFRPEPMHPRLFKGHRPV